MRRTDGREVQDIYERTFEFARRIVKVYQHLAAQGGAGRVLAGQALRSGTSIGPNLEEGRGGYSRTDSIAKAAIALKVARETHYWLRLLNACEVASAERLVPLITEANEIVAILTTIVKNARAGKPTTTGRQE